MRLETRIPTILRLRFGFDDPVSAQLGFPTFLDFPTLEILPLRKHDRDDYVV